MVATSAVCGNDVWEYNAASGFSLTSHVTINELDVAGLDLGDTFGESIDLIGDLNNDGHEDLIVGAPGDDDGGTDR